MSILTVRVSRAAAMLAAALCVAFPVPARAHDPGLSSLDVRVAGGRAVAVLALAASDARVASADATIEAFALESIALFIDGLPRPGSVSSLVRDDAGVNLTIVFERVSGSRLTISSTVPARLSRGHRQLVTVRTADQAVAQRMLDARANSIDVVLNAGRRDRGAALDFVTLGIRHILAGYDHLLFLAALLLGVGRLNTVVKTVTAFTVAHSLTLSVAVVGLARAPAAVVEPLIAASIVFVAVENLVRRQMDSRWKMTFAFGLIHGFGFAGALQGLGVGPPAGGSVVPLACFNIGVELGQIAVATMLWPAIQRMNARPQVRLRVAPVCSLLVVAAGVYWMIERTMP